MMKKITGLVLLMVMMGVLGGCYSTSCHQPTPAPANMKGEG